MIKLETGNGGKKITGDFKKNFSNMTLNNSAGKREIGG